MEEEDEKVMEGDVDDNLGNDSVLNTMGSVHPRDMSIYRHGNVFKNLLKVMSICSEETIEREFSNHTKIDQWLQYKHGSLLDEDEDYNNTKSTSQQVKISLYYEKLKKTTEVALDNFERKEAQQSNN